MNEFLTKEDIRRIKSKAIYWNEVSMRDNAGAILDQEVRYEVNELGAKILWILEKIAYECKQDE